MRTYVEDQVRIHPISCGLGFAFLVETHQGLFLIDSGSPGHENRVLAKMKELGRRDLKLIWITHAHYDHYGSAAALRAMTGAQIGVHPADAESMVNGRSPLGSPHSHGFLLQIGQYVAVQLQPLPATPPDFMLEDKGTLEAFGLDASVVYTPGHTPGHTCLQVGGIVFAGDLLGQGRSVKPQGLLATDWEQIRESCDRLYAVHPEWVYTGHSPKPVPGRVLNQIKG
ncbi:MAG: MBL fold metallo-hydrolase [Anaerolineaceae bacterium]